jgi:outer membrane phospholipase A
MEKDMERWIHVIPSSSLVLLHCKFLSFLQQRESLSKKMEKFMKKKDKAESSGQKEVVTELQEQIESLKANLTYVQDNINECQSSIMQYEETKVRSTLNILRLSFNAHCRRTRWILPTCLATVPLKKRSIF